MQGGAEEGWNCSHCEGQSRGQEGSGGPGSLLKAWEGEELTLQKQQHEDRCGQGCPAY